MSRAVLNQRVAARVVTVAMQKGGVGKTTSVINLARAAMLLGFRGLVVDLDPQGNATDALSVGTLPPGTVSVADALHPDQPMPLSDVLVPTIWPGIDLAPVVDGDTLTKVERLIQASDQGREYRLREALAPLRNDYDLVLIDNAPALGLMLANALAADPEDEEVLVVMEADRWSTTGLVRLRNAIERARQYSNPSLRWGGVLISKWRATSDEVEKLSDVNEHFPDAEVWASADDTSRCIPLWVSIKRELNQGRGLDESKEVRLNVLHSEAYTWAARRIMRGRVPDGR